MAESLNQSASAQDARALDDLPREVLDHLLEGCQVISHDYRYLYVNNAVVEQAKTTREALLGRRMKDVFPGIETTDMYAILQECMKVRRVERMENTFEFPDGSTGHFELRFEPVPEGVAILSVDITGRKQAELTLHRTMRALTTLSQCNQLLIRAEADHEFLNNVCKVMVEHGGYTAARVRLLEEPDEMRRFGYGVWEPIESGLSDNPGFPPGIEQLENRALETGQPAVRSGEDGGGPATSSHTALPIQSGTQRIGTITLQANGPEGFDKDELALLAEVALDVGHGVATMRATSAKQRATKRLEEAEARTRAIYDHLPHATLVWERTDRDYTLVDFNQTAQTLTAGSLGHLIGRCVEETDFGIPHLAEDLRHTLEEQRVITRESDCVLPGMASTLRLVLRYGFIPPNLVLLHAEDVTNLRRTEEQLAASHRLEAVGRLAGGVAHDFNNMLSVILAHAEFLMHEPSLSETMRTGIEEVHEAGRRAAGLTAQLLAFSRKQVLDPQVLNVNEVIAGINNMLHRLLGEDIEIELHCAGDLGNTLADRGQIGQVIMNLAINARDAMPEGGKLTIETANVELDAEYTEGHVSTVAGPYIQVCVSDTGTGIDPEIRNKIFEPFFTTKERDKGTGLGLSTVYGIVKQSGGNIWAYSEPHMGTTFKIYLPRIEATVTPDSPPAATSKIGGTETVLLVEDEPLVLRAAERILSSSGYRVISASNGAEAIELFTAEDGKVDLLVTDVVMPKMSGRELADTLQGLRPNLKVLYCSGYTDNAIVHHGVLDSGIRFIAKPYSLAGLTRKVREVLDEGREKSGR